MIRNYEWVDYIFIQSTAWFLGHNIIIVTTTSTENHPFMTISGNLMDENISCPGIELTIGSKSQVHYQSLLPFGVTFHTNKVQAHIPEDTIKLQASSSFKQTDNSGLELDSTEDAEDAFKYNYNGESLIFHFVSEKRVKCPKTS